MVPFWGRYGCMSLYLVFMVTLNFISLQPLLAFVHQPLGLKSRTSPDISGMRTEAISIHDGISLGDYPNDARIHAGWA